MWQISRGKVSLYVLGGGFDPRRALPVTLDLGTNNEKLLEDPMYIGARHKRLPDDLYYEIVDEFVAAVKDKWPRCLVQFEDFSTAHALPLLAKYQTQLLSFNDDIQGTGAVILAGLINALKIQGTPPADMRLVFYGAGSAAVGCAKNIIDMLMMDLGISPRDAHRQIYVLDSKGLIAADRDDVDAMATRAPHKLPFLRDDLPGGMALADVIREVQPHVLMGLSGQPGAFSREVVEAMHAAHDRPIICALSNPTSKAECTAAEAYAWTRGKAIFASGSPFAPVEVDGKTLHPSQANNLFAFPGIGRGAFLAGASQVTDHTFVDGAKCLASLVDDDGLDAGALYPPLQNLLAVSSEVAANTMDHVIRHGHSDMAHPGMDKLRTLVRNSAWAPSAQA